MVAYSERFLAGKIGLFWTREKIRRDQKIEIEPLKKMEGLAYRLQAVGETQIDGVQLEEGEYVTTENLQKQFKPLQSLKTFMRGKINEQQFQVKGTGRMVPRHIKWKNS